MSACKSKKSKEISWEGLELGEHIPKPENVTGEINKNIHNALSVTLNDVNKNQFNTYKEDCIESDYTLDVEETDSSYIAYNKDGYQIQLEYEEDKLNITLHSPEKDTQFKWSTIKLGHLLPETKSTFGFIEQDDMQTLIVRVANTSIDDFNDYVKACEDKWFIVDFQKKDKFYSAKNEEGYKLFLKYLSINKMQITLEAPLDNSSNNNSSEIEIPTTENTESSKNEIVLSSLDEKFKKAMDDYDKFIDEYVSFMKKYNASNKTESSLAADYSKFQTEYTDKLKSFEEWGNKNLPLAETAYYIQVQDRTEKKLKEIK